MHISLPHRSLTVYFCIRSLLLHSLHQPFFYLSAPAECHAAAFRENSLSRHQEDTSQVQLLR